MSQTGCDVLLQSDRLRSCEGFRGVAVARPVRIVVRGGEGSSTTIVAALCSALAGALRTIGTAVGQTEMPCGGLLHEQCMADGESHTRNVLVWVGSNGAPGPRDQAETAHWMASRPGAAAVAVVPAGVDPDLVLPLCLRDRQVVWWSGRGDAAALDVLAAAEVTTTELRLFISYSHVDGVELAHAVFETLSRARYSVFLDAFSLAPGSDFAERIEHELLEKAFLVLIETPRAIAASWVLRELAFARRHRLGIASVWSGGPRLDSIGRERRWTLPAGALIASSPRAGPSLAAHAAEDLRRFIGLRHSEALLRRRYALDSGLRAALRRMGVGGGDVVPMLGGLTVRTASQHWAVSLRPRPASLIDMHTAAELRPPGHRAVMVSATPRGRPERAALDWLACTADLPHRDEGRLLSLAHALVGGTI